VKTRRPIANIRRRPEAVAKRGAGEQEAGEG
jgi:hypothetical protein